MLNKLLSFCRQQGLLDKGDSIICAVSGGADSMALLWAMYLLKDPLELELSAAHFNHGIRGAESDRDAEFVKEFCQQYGIPFYLGSGKVEPGPKGLEAAARDARYAFFETLPGKIATAHTANDNAETVLMHLVRGTGLKGLGAIAPRRERLIRPMLSVTRQDVLAFLEEYRIPYVQDSTNARDDYLRNRLRHHVMPLLERENPRLAENLSAMALRLREDESALAETVELTNSVETLRQMVPARRRRALAAFLEGCGVKEPGAEHIALAENLVFSDTPSARAAFPGGIQITRNYQILELSQNTGGIAPTILPCPGELTVGDLRIVCEPTGEGVLKTDCFTIAPRGDILVRSRQPGDAMRLSGGTKKLKELFIDRKIPAHQRMDIPVIADDIGVLGVYGIGANLDRTSENGVKIRFEKIRI